MNRDLKEMLVIIAALAVYDVAIKKFVSGVKL